MGMGAGMDDFRVATGLSNVGEHRWRAQVYEDWALWGPAGGFMTALAIRAAGEATAFARPASFACQFLSIARFEEVELEVTSLRAGKRSEALRVDVTQTGKLILTANVWATGTGGGDDMMMHDYSGTPVIPAPDELKSYAELYPDRPAHPFMSKMEQRPIDPAVEGDLTPREPEINSLFRWGEEGLTADDPFVDAGRIMMFMDTHAWLATYAAHPSNGPSPWIAPNLDFYYQFHRPTGEHEWVHQKNRADLACDSLIATQSEVHDLAGHLLVRGWAQLMCSRRPEQFR